MRGLSYVRLLLVVIFLIPNPIDVMGFGFLRVLISPPMPRLNRIKNSTPREARKTDPLAVSDFVGLVKQYNYPAEEHNVTTIDGYKLMLHRIPYSPNSPPSKKKPIVLLQHGLFASADSWVLMGPGKDLAYLLADDGYDVWLGNFRGNTYSRFHTVLNPEDPAFWQFSFHEMAIYDLPAMIDYILEIGGQKSLIYVGHSMGTTTSYVLLSSKPEYNKRIRLVVSFAPVAYWRHDLLPYQKFIAQNGVLLQETFRSRGIFELIPQSNLNSRLGEAFCNDNAVTQSACVNVISTFAGFDYPQLNASFIPYLTRYFPAGASLKTLLHYYQHLSTGQFRPFDYGHVGNFERYGRTQPSEYYVANITTRVALFYGLGDYISREEDAKELTKRLPNVVISEAISYKMFNHFDFLWANEGKRLLYDDVIKFIHRFK